MVFDKRAYNQVMVFLRNIKDLGRPAVVAAFIAMVFWAAPSTASDDPCLREIGRWPYGPSYAIEMDYPRLYLGSGTVLEILDISDSVHPIQISHLILPDLIKDMEMHGAHLFLALSIPALAIVDINDPCSPQVLSILPLDGFEVLDLSVAGSNAYIIVNSVDLIIVDVSDPLFPQVIGKWHDQYYIARLVATDDGLVYVAYRTYGFYILDVHDPNRPIQLGGSSVSNLGPIDDIQKHGPVVYLHAHYYGPASWGGLFAFDISDPLNVKKITFSTEPGISENVFVTPSEDDFALVDISEPLQPRIKAWIWWGSMEPHAELYGNIVYRSQGYGGLQIMDCTDTEHPIVAGTYGLAENPWKIILNGEQALSDYLRSTLTVIDISVPGTLAKKNTFEFGEWIGDFEIENDILYVSTSNAFHILSLGKQGEMSKIGEIHGVSGGLGFVRAENWAYVINHNELHVLDISNLDAPTVEGHIELGYSYYVGGIAPGALYLLDGTWENPGLRIYDLSDPISPVEVAFIAGIFPDGLVIKGHYLFLSGKSEDIRELIVFDIQDPLQPAEAARLPLPSWGGLMAHGDFLFVRQNLTLNIIDISNPLEPAVRHSVELKAGGSPSDADDNRIVVLSGDYGWYLYDISRCAHSAHDRPVRKP